MSVYSAWATVEIIQFQRALACHKQVKPWNRAEFFFFVLKKGSTQSEPMERDNPEIKREMRTERRGETETSCISCEKNSWCFTSSFSRWNLHFSRSHYSPENTVNKSLPSVFQAGSLYWWQDYYIALTIDSHRDKMKITTYRFHSVISYYTPKA